METVKLIAAILISLLTIASQHGTSDVPYVTVPVNYGARNYLSSDSTTIVLVNKVDFSQAKISNQKKIDVLKAGAYTSIKYAENLLKQLPRVKVISLVDSTKFIANADSVKLLASKYGAKHVLTLNSFEADIVLSDVQSSTPYFNTNINAGFTLYESNGIYYKKLNGTASDLLPDVKYIFGFYGALYIHPPIERYKMAIDTSAQNAALDALQDYLPSSISHDRPLYNDHFLMNAVTKIYASDLDAAVILLKPQLKNKNNKKASRAAYDLAVVYEAKADIETAIAMAQLSLNKFDNKYASAILEDLKVE
jgi:Family of unknown function (DUF6340)